MDPKNRTDFHEIVDLWCQGKGITGKRYWYTYLSAACAFCPSLIKTCYYHQCCKPPVTHWCYLHSWGFPVDKRETTKR